MSASPALVGFDPAPFLARRGVGNPHVMTVAAWASARQFPDLPAPEARLIRVAEDSQAMKSRPSTPTWVQSSPRYDPAASTMVAEAMTAPI